MGKRPVADELRQYAPYSRQVYVPPVLGRRDRRGQASIAERERPVLSQVFPCGLIDLRRFRSSLRTIMGLAGRVLSAVVYRLCPVRREGRLLPPTCKKTNEPKIPTNRKALPRSHEKRDRPGYNDTQKFCPYPVLNRCPLSSIVNRWRV